MGTLSVLISHRLPQESVFVVSVTAHILDCALQLIAADTMKGNFNLQLIAGRRQ